MVVHLKGVLSVHLLVASRMNVGLPESSPFSTLISGQQNEWLPTLKVVLSVHLLGMDESSARGLADRSARSARSSQHTISGCSLFRVNGIKVNCDKVND